MQKVFVRVAAAVLCLMCLHQGWQILLYSQPSSKNPAQNAIGHDSPIVNAQAGSSYLNGHLEYYNQKNHAFALVAFARVEVYNESGGGEYLGNCSSDINGNFTVGPIDSSPSGINVRCNVSTQTDAVTLYNGDPSPIVYSYSISNILIPAGQNKSMSNQYSDLDRGFTVFSYDTGLTKGWYYILNSTGDNTVGAKAYYPFVYGPEYDNNTREIHLPAGTHLYTDSILHEYAHYVMHGLYRHDSEWWWPSGYNESYAVNKKNSGNSTAWIEGWAYYFPLAVKNNGTYDEYWGSWEIENQHWNTSGWDDGDTVVGRVAGAFLDIYDEHNDTGLWSYENMTDGFGRTWNTISTACYYHCDQFRMFWVIWNGTYYTLDPDTHQKSSSSPYNGQDWKNTLMTMFQDTIDYRAPGDVIVDGKVNVKDLSYVLAHNWEHEGVSPNWNYLADLVHDSKIDAKDAALVTANIGNKYDC